MSDIEEEIEDDAIADGQDDDDPFGEAGRETGSSRGEYGSSSMRARVVFCLSLPRRSTRKKMTATRASPQHRVVCGVGWDRHRSPCPVRVP
jgi:hypothetical protein